MKTFRIETGLRIAPFGDPVGETFLLQGTLAASQADAVRACAGAGLSPEIAAVRPGETVEGPAFVFRDDAWFTAHAIREFLGASGPPTGQLAARDCLFLTRNRALQDLESVEIDGVRHDRFPLWRVAPGERFVVPGGVAEGQGPAAPAAEPVAIDLAEKRLSVPVPPQFFDTDRFEIGVTARGVMCVRHWVHVLRVNHAASGAAWQATPRWKSILVVLWAVLRAFSLNKWRVLAKLGRRGKGCDVHPTAVVEGSTLGEGCVIGPGARVRFSHLGDRVTVMGGAQVEFSVIGDRALVSQNCAANFCVLYPGAGAAQQLMQSCLLGRNAVTTGGAFSLDLHFSRDVMVEKDGRLESAGTRFLGCCLGHDVKLGTGFWLNSGRAVPNGYVIVRDPDAVLSRIPKDLPAGAPLAARGKTLVSAE